ncbi:unnamed protein product, partial [Brenthis ino]
MIFSRNNEYIRKGKGFRRCQPNRLRVWLYLADEEDLDDDALGDYDNTVPTDIAGTYEIHTDLPAEPENTQGEPGLSTSKKPRLPKKSPKCVPDWKKWTVEKIQKMVNVPQLQVITYYNKNMGDIDLH